VASFFNNFLKALAAGDGVNDYTHASRVFRDDGYALTPKSSFLYYVLFEFNEVVRPYTDFSADPQRSYEIGVLVKNITLPSFQIAISEKNQYGKHTYTQTRINYNPVSVTFHDDMANTITEFWANYYKYYYADSNKNKSVTSEDSYKYRSDFDTNNYGYKGFSPRGDSVEPFLKSIKVYSLHKKEFTEYTLVKPVIETMSHGTHDSAGSSVMEQSMSLRYENVLYGKGNVANGSPQGFFLHYDTNPSPISSNNRSVLGKGGLVDTIGDVITDIGNGDLLGAGLKILRGKETFEDVNIGDVFKEEALGVVSDIARASVQGSVVPEIQSRSASAVNTTINTTTLNPNINVNGQNG